MKKLFQKPIVFVYVGLLTLLSFQNCSQSGQIATSSQLLGKISTGIDQGSTPLQVVVNPPPANTEHILPVNNPPAPQPEACAKIEISDIKLQFEKFKFKCKGHNGLGLGIGTGKGIGSGIGTGKGNQDCEAFIKSKDFSLDNNEVEFKLDEDVEIEDGDMSLVYANSGHEAMKSDSDVVSIESSGHKKDDGLKFSNGKKHSCKAGHVYKMKIDVELKKEGSKCLVRPVVKSVEFKKERDDDDDDKDDDDDHDSDHSKHHGK